MYLSRSTFDSLRRSIYQICGLVVSDDKEYLIQYRLQPVVEDRGLAGFEGLSEELRRASDESLIAAVVDAVTTQETSFFRDRHVFDALAQNILPQLCTSCTTHQRRVRILSAGVSTGQEAFSLAMLAFDALTRSRTGPTPGCRFSILGSDISTHALRIAEAAIYDHREVRRGLTEAQVHRYFDPDQGGYRVRESIRKLVDFRHVNLTKSISTLGSFDLICCRNVLIYFDEHTRMRICDQFHHMLKDDGWLLLGAAENLFGTSKHFVSVPLGDALIYRKAGLF